MSLHSNQIILPLTLPYPYSFKTWHSGSNALIAASCKSLAAGANGTSIWVWGEACSGRSHLLQAAVRHANERGRSAMYVPLQAEQLDSTLLLNALSEMQFVALDDLDAVVGNRECEMALFALYNTCRQKGQQLLISSALPPSQLPFGVSDLRTRMQWGMVNKLHYADADRLALLRVLAARRGIDLPDDAARYLMWRIERSNQALFDWVEKLDIASLQQKRRVNVALMRELLD